MIKTFVCQVCGHFAFDEAPVDCPVYGMAIENFENNPASLKSPVASDNLTEFEKKHFTVIMIDNECDAVSEGTCMDVQVKFFRQPHCPLIESFMPL